MYRFPRITGLLVSLLVCATTFGQDRAHGGKVVLFGNLHAHSSLSDDISAPPPGMTPLEGFTSAHANGLDFLAISDHHKAPDSPHRLYLKRSEYRRDLRDVARQYNEDHAGSFVAIPAIEWGNTATGNHINVFGLDELPPDSIKDADYDELLEWAVDEEIPVQFNHPYSWYWKSNRDKSVGNFGEALYDNSHAWVRAIDDAASTISIICTVAGGHISGTFRHATTKTHRDVHPKHYGIWLRLLNKGLHISPAANQDTHWTNWGSVTAARTAVWADTFSYDALLDGLRAGRVYATEDDELVVAAQVRFDGHRYWMGETVPISGSEADVELLLTIRQLDGTIEGPYTAIVHSDSDGTGGSQAAEWTRVAGLESGSEHVIPLHVVDQEYFFVQIVEENGADNPIGDRDSDADGRNAQEDMNDNAWTAPFWFASDTADVARFVWSVNSGIYHDPGCWAASRIGMANRREGSAPGGKTKHNCPPGS